MSVIKNITTEYFGDVKRDEDITPFDRYMETVEWVDMGHPKYFFAKTDFLKRPDVYEKYKQIGDNDEFSAIEICDLLENIRQYEGCSLMTKPTFWWLMKKNDFELIRGKQLNGLSKEKMLITKPGTDISIDLFLDWKSFDDTYISNSVKRGEYYYIDKYTFSPTIEKRYVDSTTKSGKNNDFIPNPDKCQFLFKLIKEKPKKK
jgi:hypothetical protein